MTRARRSKSARIPPLLLLAATTLALVGVSYVAFTIFGADNESDPSRAGTTGAASASTVVSVSVSTPSSRSAATAGVDRSAIPTPSTPAKPADRCAAEVGAAEAELAAARIAVEHWREHVQARTDLLAGRIDQATTKAIWKRTRLAGPTDLEHLTAATTAHAAARGGCTNTPGTKGTACRHRLTALAAAIAAGHAASRDWQAHLAMMAAHKAGAMDNAHAQTMWVAAWRAAPPHLTEFAHADRNLTRTPPCTPG